MNPPLFSLLTYLTSATNRGCQSKFSIGLKMYNGTNGVVPHDFSVSHDADNATVREGTEPTFTFTANETAEVHFLDISTQTLAATYVVGADRIPAEYVNGLPVVAKVERCGWEQPVWALRGVVYFELGAAAVEVHALGDDEVLEAKYYHPPGGSGGVDDCGSVAFPWMVSGTGDYAKIKRGCRAKIPNLDQSATERLPCAIMDKTYVDELPKKRIFDVDLSVLGTGSSGTSNATCPADQVSDCSDDDCCAASWIGDGICDGPDQRYGCDLSCYSNDGGDCPVLMPDCLEYTISGFTTSNNGYDLSGANGVYGAIAGQTCPADGGPTSYRYYECLTCASSRYLYHSSSWCVLGQCTPRWTISSGGCGASPSVNGDINSVGNNANVPAWRLTPRRLAPQVDCAAAFKNRPRSSNITSERLQTQPKESPGRWRT